MFVVAGSDEDDDLLQCHRVADELQQAAGRAVRLQQQVNFLSRRGGVVGATLPSTCQTVKMEIPV